MKSVTTGEEVVVEGEEEKRRVKRRVKRKQI